MVGDAFCFLKSAVVTSGRTAQAHAQVGLNWYGRRYGDYPTTFPSGGNGSTDLDSAGRVVKLTFTGTSTSSSFTEYFSYDSKGRLIKWEHQGSSSSKNATEYLDYDSNGRLTKSELVTSASSTNLTEYLTYDSSGRLTKWERITTGPDGAATATFTYTGTALTKTETTGAISGAMLVDCK
ncbi:MAG: hypothetical protein NVSMB1_10380 [Polyangiales bacterium]